jgi:hypothetical protein
MIAIDVNYFDCNDECRTDLGIQFDHLPRVGDTVFYKGSELTVQDVTFIESNGIAHVSNVTLGCAKSRKYQENNLGMIR